MVKKKLFRILSESNQGLKQKATRGAIWVFLIRVSNNFLWLIRIIVLARLLTPKDFGLFGLAWLVLSTLETFTQIGFEAALIQKKENTELYLDVAWTVQFFRGVGLACLLWISAAPVALFFDEPYLLPLLRALAPVTLIQGLTNIGIIYFQKELEFHKQLLFQFSGALFDITATILIAWLVGNVWALVGGVLTGRFIQMIVSYLIHSYRPHISWDKQKFLDLYRFGRWIFSASVLYALIISSINAFIGRILGTTAVGFYQMTYRISVFPLDEINYIVKQVSFPVYVKMQNQLSRLQTGYLQILQSTMLVSFPLIGYIVIFGPDAIPILLGEQWIPIIASAQILAFWSISRSINAITFSFFKAVGRPAMITWLGGIRLLLLLSLMYPLTMRWGLEGAAMAITLSAFPVTGLAVYMIFRVIQCSPGILGRIFFLPIGGTLVMSGSILLLRNWLPESIGLLLFILLLLTALAIYLGIIKLCEQLLMIEISLDIFIS